MGSIGQWNWAVAVATARFTVHNVRRIYRKWPAEQNFIAPIHEVIFCASNLAFSSELYLKSLLVALTDQNPPNSHKLSTLLQNIPRTEREKLCKNTDYIFEKKYKNLRNGEIWIKVSDGPMPTDKRPSNLWEVLDHYSSDYTRWRYMFSYNESQQPSDLHCLHYSRLISLCEATDGFLQERFPEIIGKNEIRFLSE